MNIFQIGLIALIILLSFGKYSVDNFDNMDYGKYTTKQILKLPLYKQLANKIINLEQELDQTQRYEKDYHNRLHKSQHFIKGVDVTTHDFPPIVENISKNNTAGNIDSLVNNKQLFQFKQIGTLGMYPLFARPNINKWNYYINVDDRHIPLKFDEMLHNGDIIVFKQQSLAVNLFVI